MDEVECISDSIQLLLLGLRKLQRSPAFTRIQNLTTQGAAGAIQLGGQIQQMFALILGRFGIFFGHVSPLSIRMIHFNEDCLSRKKFGNG